MTMYGVCCECQSLPPLHKDYDGVLVMDQHNPFGAGGCPGEGWLPEPAFRNQPFARLLQNVRV